MWTFGIIFQKCGCRWYFSMKFWVVNDIDKFFKVKLYCSLYVFVSYPLVINALGFYFSSKTSPWNEKKTHIWNENCVFSFPFNFFYEQATEPKEFMS
jgi:hypothetical protein